MENVSAEVFFSSISPQSFENANAKYFSIYKWLLSRTSGVQQLGFPGAQNGKPAGRI